MRSKIHRNIWIKHNGPIPLDEDGRSYEIHHKDGNRYNNAIENLMCVSIQEHYNIHYMQRDWKACHIILKRMRVVPYEAAMVATKSMEGRIWITDGVNDKSIYPNDHIPDGWYRGRTKGKRYGARSLEFRQKMSDIKKGKPLSEKHRQSLLGLKRGMAGKKHTKETKIKMSLAMKNAKRRNKDDHTN